MTKNYIVMCHQELSFDDHSYQGNFMKAKNLGFLLEAFTLTIDTSISFAVLPPQAFSPQIQIPH